MSGSRRECAPGPALVAFSLGWYVIPGAVFSINFIRIHPMHRNLEEQTELYSEMQLEPVAESEGHRPPVAGAQDQEQQGKGEASFPPQKEKEPVFQIRLSRALHRKLLSKAQTEGVSPQDLARELLSEGLVLRAWEIIERKNTMRSSAGNNFGQGSGRNQSKGGHRNSHQQGGHNYGRNRQNNYNGHPSGGGHNGRRGNFNHILEDSANFMEYVRSQEKKNS